MGVTQLEKLDDIMAVQRHNKAIIKSYLERIKGMRFRKILDPQGDNASFLSFFMPDEIQAQAVVKQLYERGVTDAFYWYDNNWHYVHKWDHLKGVKTPAALPRELRENLPDYASQDFSQSDAVLRCCLSISIQLSWTEDEAQKQGKDIAEAVRKVLKGAR